MNNELRSQLAAMTHEELVEWACMVSRSCDDLYGLVALIPECPVHGNQCIPHAKDWIKAQLATPELVEIEAIDNGL